MNDTRFVTPLGNDGMYILDTAAWRIVRPVMDKEKCINTVKLRGNKHVEKKENGK